MSAEVDVFITVCWHERLCVKFGQAGGKSAFCASKQMSHRCKLVRESFIKEPVSYIRDLCRMCKEYITDLYEPHAVVFIVAG